MFITNKMLRNRQLERDRKIVERILPVGTKVMLINEYCPSHSWIIGQKGKINGYSYGASYVNVQFDCSDSFVEELVPMEIALDVIKVVNE